MKGCILSSGWSARHECVSEIKEQQKRSNCKGDWSTKTTESFPFEAIGRTGVESGGLPLRTHSSFVSFLPLVACDSHMKSSREGPRTHPACTAVANKNPLRGGRVKKTVGQGVISLSAKNETAEKSESADQRLAIRFEMTEPVVGEEKTVPIYWRGSEDR